MGGKRPIVRIGTATHSECVKTTTSTNGTNDFSKSNGLRREPLFGDPQWIAERIRWIKGNVIARRKEQRGAMFKMQAIG